MSFICVHFIFFFFFFNDTATTEIYTLSLHDALPISPLVRENSKFWNVSGAEMNFGLFKGIHISMQSLRTILLGGLAFARSEEHTSELQSRRDLVCRLLLEKKKKKKIKKNMTKKN